MYSDVLYTSGHGGASSSSGIAAAASATSSGVTILPAPDVTPFHSSSMDDYDYVHHALQQHQQRHHHHRQLFTPPPTASYDQGGGPAPICWRTVNGVRTRLASCPSHFTMVFTKVPPNPVFAGRPYRTNFKFIVNKTAIGFTMGRDRAGNPIDTTHTNLHCCLAKVYARMYTYIYEQYDCQYARLCACPSVCRFGI